MKIFIKIVIAFVFAFSFLNISAVNEDSLLKVIKSQSSADLDKLKALEKLISLYDRKDPSKVPSFMSQLETIYGQLKDTAVFVGSYHMLKGKAADYVGEHKTAINHYEMAEKIYLKANKYQQLWSVYNNIGFSFQNVSNLPKALEYYLKSIDIAEKHLKEDDVAGTAMNIGTIYAEQGMFKEALSYFKLSANIYSKKKGWGYGNDVNNIGQVYFMLKQLDSAKYYYDEAINVWTRMNDQQGLAMTYHNLGNLYAEMNNFPEAEKHLQKSLDLSYSMGDSYGITVNLGALSRLAISTGNKEKGRKYLNESVAYAEKSMQLGLLSDNYKQLYGLYKSENNFKEALAYHEKYFETYDSIHSTENNKLLKEMQEKYESGKKQVEIDKQKLELSNKDLKLSEQNRRSTIYISIIIVAIITILLVFYQFRQKQRSNKIILLQKQEVEKQKEIVDEKNKEIVDSMIYAKRLQDAILPPISLIRQHLPQSFVLFKPKDIVAGDFYWFEQKDHLLWIAAADCTGHGVPGAMVSVVCSNALHRTVNEFGIITPGEILNTTRSLVLETFAKSESEVKDGMDISMLCIDSKHKKIFWSGANNPLWYIQYFGSSGENESNKLVEIKANKQPVGKIDNPAPFTTHEINYIEGSVFYLFTDGFADQFGGPNGKKFKYKQFNELLVANSTKPLQEQSAILEKAFNSWKGDLEQVDDVCVIGIKV